MAAEWGEEAELPLPRDTKEQFTARIASDPDPARPLEVGLNFDKAFSAAAVPVIEWSLAEPEWVPVTAHYDAGGLRAWTGSGGVCFGLPLRLHALGGRPLIPRLNLIDVATNKTLDHLDCPVQPDRGLHEGDVVWAGTLMVTPAKAGQWAGKTLALTLLPLMQDPHQPTEAIRDPFTGGRHRYAPLEQYCLTFVRFTEQGGSLRPQFAPPPE